MKTLIKNASAKFNYDILDEYVAGIVLFGYEVKAIKDSNASLNGSYISVTDSGVMLRNMSISINNRSYLTRYENPDLNRDKALLLNKHEILKIRKSIYEKGMTIIPLNVSLSRNLVKVNIGLCKGRKLHEKKEFLKEKDIKRDSDREIKFFK